MRLKWRLGLALFVRRINVVVEVVKPNEENLVMRAGYNRLMLKVPYLPCASLKDLHPDKQFEYSRRVSVYHNGSFVIVDPKPVIAYSLAEECGRRAHVVEITLFQVVGEPSKGMVLEYANSTLSIHHRAYDYSSVAEVLINGAKAYPLNIGERNIVRLVIVREGLGSEGLKRYSKHFKMCILECLFLALLEALRGA